MQRRCDVPGGHGVLRGLRGLLLPLTGVIVVARGVTRGVPDRTAPFTEDIGMLTGHSQALPVPAIGLPDASSVGPGVRLPVVGSKAMSPPS